MKEFDFDAVPYNWAICFNNDCPLAEQCQRKLAGDHTPASLKVTTCVTPRALKDGKCSEFFPIKVVTMACGFSQIFQPVLKLHFTSMRKSMTEYLHGKKMYYEYRKGERLLNPKQQAWINRLFEQYGYATPVTFDGEKICYDFD